MQNKLKEIQKKLNKQPISSLSKEEVELYFEHRLQNLVSSKKVLVRNELEYLLGETGSGPTRIEPDLFRVLASKKILVRSPFESIPEIQKLKKLKEVAEKHIAQTINSPETQNLLKKIFANYIKKISRASKEPLIFEGELGTTPVACMIKNGAWVFPDAELFSFLKSSQEQRRFPMVIAKKISGILFPVFKGLFIMGLNTYKILLPEKSREIVDAVKSDDELLRELKYNNQFQFNECESIQNFFEVTLEEHIDIYSRNFARSKIKIADNFIETITQFRKSKATQALIENFERKQTLITNITTSISS